MSNESKPKNATDESIDSLLVGIVLTIILFLGVPWLFGQIGWTSAPTPKGWLVLVVTCCAIVAKLVLGDVASGEFLFYKIGYENCVMTFGASITAVAIQLTSPQDLFPGFRSAGPFAIFESLSSDTIMVRIIQLFTFSGITLLFTLLTARISRAIKSGKADPRGMKSLFNSLAGGALLVFYVLLLVAKG